MYITFYIVCKTLVSVRLCCTRTGMTESKDFFPVRMVPVSFIGYPFLSISVDSQNADIYGLPYVRRSHRIL